MKTFLLSFFCILLVGSSYAQRNANAFSSIMTSAPVEGKTLVTDVTYKDGAFNGVEKRLIKHKKSLRSTRNDYVLMGHLNIISPEELYQNYSKLVRGMIHFIS